MPFRVWIKLYTPWCLLLLLSCSTSYHNLSVYNPTGEYVVMLHDGEKISDIKKDDDSAWSSEELKKIFASVYIMGKISALETLLVSNPGYSDVEESKCADGCVKGQSWVYNEKDNTLKRVRAISTGGEYADKGSLADIELSPSNYSIDAYSDASDESKKGSKYYWVGKDSYWVQSNRKGDSSSVAISKEHQCFNDAKKSNRKVAVKYSTRVEEDDEGYWKRRNLNECFYEDKRKPRLLYLNQDSLIVYTKGSLVYFNDDYQKGMIIPPADEEPADEEDDANEFITDFFDDADGIQAGLGERESFWVKKSSKALMFHKSSDDDEHTVFNYTRFELAITADKMAMWVDRKQDGDADSKVLIASKILYIEGGELKAAEVKFIDKAYAYNDDEQGEDES